LLFAVVICYANIVNGQASYGVYACVMTCGSQGTRYFPPGTGASRCRLDNNCALPFTGSYGACSDASTMTFDVYPFSSTDACSNFYDQMLAPSSSTEKSTKTNVQKAQCGCTNVTNSLLDEAVGQLFGNSFCDFVIGKLTGKFKNMVCGSSSFIDSLPLVSDICKGLVDIVTGLAGPFLSPVCEDLVSWINRELGLDINSFYNKGESFVRSQFDHISRSVCGTLTCESSSTGGGACKAVTSAASSNKFMLQAVSIICSSAQPFYSISQLVFIVSLLLFILQTTNIL